MEVNINSDLGESSKFHSTENDPALLKIVNSANIAWVIMQEMKKR